MADDADKSGYPRGDLDLAALHRALQGLYRSRALIGSMPMAPATARGRLGAVLVGLVRRALFWLWPQLDLLHAAMINFAESQAALMQELREHLSDIDQGLEEIRRDLSSLGKTGIAEDLAPDQAGALWLQLVRCQARVEAVRHEIHLQDEGKATGRPI